MKKLFGLVAVFFAFLIGVFAFLAMFPPTGLALRMVAAGLRNHAGVDLKVAGGHSLRLFPEVVLRLDDVTLTTVDSSRTKPLATAKSLQVNASLMTALRGRHVDRIVLVEPDIDLDIGKDGLPVGVSMAPRRVTAATPRQPITVGVVEVTGARIAYRDQRDGTEARFERTRATLKDVQLDRFAQALVNAGAVTVKAPGQVGAFEISDLDATVSDFEINSVREFSGNGTALKWRDAAGRSTLDAVKFTASARSINANGADAVIVTAGDATWREPSGRSLRTSVVSANVANLRSEGAGVADVKAGLFSWREASGETYEAANLAARAGTVRMEGIGSLDLKAGAAAWRDASGRGLEAVDVAGTAKSVKPGRIDDLDVASTRATWNDAKRSNSHAGGIAIEQATFKTALLATGTPIDGVAGFRWNGERVDAKVKLPPPHTLGTAASLPATIAMATSRGTLDFDGVIDTMSGAAKGKTRAISTSVEQLATWLGMTVPATVKGPVNVTGDIDAGTTRIALSNGRIDHGGNTLAGNLAVDMTNARPRLTGRLASDKLVVDNYLGYEPPKPSAPAPQSQASAKPRPLSVPRPIEVEPEVQLGDIFKSYVRSMVDAPVRNGVFDIPALSAETMAPAQKRSGSKPGFAWSTTPIDLSALRSVDLDVDWSVKQFSVRGMDLSVPQLKTTLDAGALTLQGRDVGTKEGRLSGEARIDARQNVPSVAAKISGTGVDVLALTEALGLPPMLDGVSTLEADVRTTGSNQRQLVEQLSGRVKTDMPQGEVIGYDLGNISLSTLVGYFFGSRRFDPDRRTPISALKADLEIEKGLVRDSQVSLGGPFLGVNAEGTIKLVEQQLDYSGRARIASIFSGLRFKLFGDWTAPSFQPDILGFSRGGPGEPSLADIVSVADIKPDAEMALLVGRALLKATTSGADANTMALLQALQRKALGN